MFASSRLKLKNTSCLLLLALPFSGLACNDQKLTPGHPKEVSSVQRKNRADAKLFSLGEPLDPPELELEGVRFTQYENGDVIWLLDAIKAQLFEKDGYVLLCDIEVKFFGDGEKNVNVVGKKGKLSLKRNDFTLEGDIVAVSDGGVTVCTEQLFWDSESKRIKTNTKVEIINGSTTIRSGGLEASCDLEKIWLKDNVITVIQ